MPATCERYAAGLYEQALLTLGDPVLAEQVVGDVLLNECALTAAPGRGEDGARYRLAKPVFRGALPAA